MSVLEVGDVAQVELHIFPNADLVFQLEWWLDEDETEGQDLGSIRGQVRTADGVLLIDFIDYVTMVDNKAMIRVPRVAMEGPSVDDDWPSKAEWDFILVATTLEEKPVARGPVTIHKTVTSG